MREPNAREHRDAMSELAIAKPDQPLTASPPAPDKPEPKRLRIGKKLQIAIDAIVFEGMDLQKAAQTAKTSTRVLRRALERRHVIMHLRKRREVLRASACGSNISRLVAIRDAADNMPAVQAIRDLERLGDEAHSPAGAMQRAPGVTVVVVQQGVSQAPVREISTAYANIRALDETADEPKR